MATELTAARDRGETLALLHASEYPIYGRFGFGPASQAATWTVDALRARVPGSARPGAVRIASATIESRDTLRQIFEAWRLHQPGEIWRRDFSWDDDLGLRTRSWGPPWNGYVAFRDDPDGNPDGYVRYHVDPKWEHRQSAHTLVVDELHTLSDEAYADLWRLMLDIDLVVSVRAEHRSPAERLPWLLPDARAARSSDTGDDLWLAILDLPRALAARGYERCGSMVIEAVESSGVAGDHRTRVILEASPEGATCVSTDRSPDLTLDEAALAAAYLGGTRLGDAVLAKGVDEHRPGALADADALFRTTELPWCSTGF
jgi:predicted acetyltransferase